MNLVRQLIPKQWILEKRTWEWLQFPIAWVNNVNVKRSRPICIRERSGNQKVAATRTRTKTPRNEEFTVRGIIAVHVRNTSLYISLSSPATMWHDRLSSAYFGEHGSRLQGFYSMLNMTALNLTIKINRLFTLRSAIDTLPIMFSFILSLKRFRLYL